VFREHNDRFFPDNSPFNIIYIVNFIKYNPFNIPNGIYNSEKLLICYLPDPLKSMLLKISVVTIKQLASGFRVISPVRIPTRKSRN